MIFRIGLLVGALVTFSSFSQDELKKNMFYGNEAFWEGDYERAAAYYLDAVDQSPLNFKANYNLANAYYRMSQPDKAIERITTVINLAPSSYDRSKAYHNIGNAHMIKQDLNGAIDAYKNALRLNSSDEETRYNLAYALQLKKEQEQNQDQNQNENSNGDGQNMGENQDESEGNGGNNKEESNKENKGSNSDTGDGNKGEQEDQGSPDQNPEDKQDEEGNGQSYSSKLSKEQIQNILDAYYKRERELQKKLDKDKRVGYGSPKKKDW